MKTQLFLHTIKSASTSINLKNLLILSVFALCIPLNAQVLNSTKDIFPESNISKIKSLNGQWKFQYINGTSLGNYSSFYATGFDDSKWSTIPVPGNWETNGIKSLEYGSALSDVLGLYRTTFTVPSAWASNHVVLRFEGVKYGYEVWINGNSVGVWESAYNPCQFDISQYVNIGGQNTLAVKVYTHPKGWEFDTNDEWSLSGIDRDVKIFPVPDIHFNDITLTTPYVNATTSAVAINSKISSFSSALSSTLSVRANLLDAAGNLVGTTTTALNATTSGWNISQSIPVNNPISWNAETPYLYKLDLSILDGNTVVQNMVQKTGIKNLTLGSAILKLNGAPIKFRGINMHENNPITGKAITKEMFVSDIKMMKQANINGIRTSHYPPAPYFFDVCDSLGMYVDCEVPFGYGDANLTDATYKDILKTRGNATITRDKNHPSVIFWSLGNENPFTFLSDTLAKYVKQLDSSRPIDFPQVNDTTILPKYVDLLSKHYPNSLTTKYTRPIIADEYSHSSGLAFENHTKVWTDLENNSSCFGGCVWLWADQGILQNASASYPYPGDEGNTFSPWINQNQYYNSNMKLGTDGIVFANRLPQSDYYQVKKNYSQIYVATNIIRIIQGTQNISFSLKNKYHFINLKDRFTCKWYLTQDKDTIQSGSFVPDCAPAAQITSTINITAPGNPANRIYLLNLDFIDNQGTNLYNRVVKLLPVSGNVNIASRLDDITLPAAPKVEMTTAVDKTTFNSAEFGINNTTGIAYLNVGSENMLYGPFVKTGRNVTMGEDERFSRTGFTSISKYYISNSAFIRSKTDSVITTSYTFSNGSSTAMNFQGNVDFRPSKSGWINGNYSLTQKTNATFSNVLECGVSFLINPKLTQFRWHGYGPFNAYPGKNELNEWGFYQTANKNLYFAGNHGGVKAALFTDTSGNGIAILCDSCNIDIEKTGEGYMVTFVNLLQGQGTRLSDTTYPITVNSSTKITGNFNIIPLQGSKWPHLFTELFGASTRSVPSDNPFVARYDYYKIKLSDVMNNYNGTNYAFNGSYTLSTQSAGFGKGTISISPAQDTYAAGTVVTLKAKPNSGCTFSGWTGDVISPDSVITVTMNSSKTLIANFQANSNFLKIAYVTDASNSLYASDLILDGLRQEPNFFVDEVLSTVTGVDYSNYDVVLVSEIANSTAIGLPALKGINKPMLFMKPKSYVASWAWGTSSTSYGYVSQTNMVVSQPAHSIFNNPYAVNLGSNAELQAISSVSNSKGLTFMDPSAFTSVTKGTINPIATVKGSTGTSQTSILEIPEGTVVSGTTVPKKFIQIGIAADSYLNVTTDAINLIKNACYYVSGFYSGINRVWGDKQNDLKLTVYPNPARNLLNIRFTMEEVSPVTIEIFSLTGSRIQSMKLNASTGINTVNLNVSDINHGIYILSLNASGKSSKTMLALE